MGCILAFGIDLTVCFFVLSHGVQVSRFSHLTLSTQTEKHTNQITPKLQNIMLVSQIYSHTYSRYFALIENVYFAAKYECIELSAQQHHLDQVGQCPTCP